MVLSMMEEGTVMHSPSIMISTFIMTEIHSSNSVTTSTDTTFSHFLCVLCMIVGQSFMNQLCNKRKHTQVTLPCLKKRLLPANKICESGLVPFQNTVIRHNKDG